MVTIQRKEKKNLLDKHTEKLELLVETNGKKQLIVALEELSELQKEICKDLRGKTNIDHITEELADVMIMTEQLKIYYGISEEDLAEVIDEKVKRTMKLI